MRERERNWIIRLSPSQTHAHRKLEVWCFQHCKWWRSTSHWLHFCSNASLSNTSFCRPQRTDAPGLQAPNRTTRLKYLERTRRERFPSLTAQHKHFLDLNRDLTISETVNIAPPTDVCSLWQHEQTGGLGCELRSVSSSETDLLRLHIHTMKHFSRLWIILL